MKEGAEGVYRPIVGRLLGIAVTSVTTSREDILLPDAQYRTEINKQTKEQELQIYHPGTATGEDLRSTSEVSITFNNPVRTPKRILVHVRRNSERDGALPMAAAARLNEDKAFGFSLQPNDRNPEGQNFLNLLYFSEKKPAGFEPLYIKLKTKEGNLLYLQIKVEEKVDGETKSLTVSATAVSESEAPAHLVSAEFPDFSRKTVPNPADSKLAAKLFRK